jgi:hypothetical protein
VTHGQYNFYNPTQHPFFDQEGGRVIYFEGTYSDFFSGAHAQTPRYDYNQLMYRLALDDPRLTLPIAVYRVHGTDHTTYLWPREKVEASAAWERIEGVAWFALPGMGGGRDIVPVYALDTNGAALSLTPQSSNATPLFTGLPVAESEPGTTLDGSWDFRAMMPDGGEVKFALTMALEGETVHVSGLGEDSSGSGTFREGNLTLILNIHGGTYVVEGRLDKRSLAGPWHQDGASAKGTWTAVAKDTTPPERRSPALVVLREYHRTADGTAVYSTEQESPAGCEPGGKSLCLVWKVPGSVLVLDWKAKPLPFGAIQ